MRQEQSAVSAMIAAAAALGRWDELETAVDLKIAQQQDFVAHWDAHVRSQGDARKKFPTEKFLSVAEIRKTTGVSAVQASRWRSLTAPDRLVDYRQHVIDAAQLAAELKARANHRAEGTGLNEWYTPRDYIEAARFVLGGQIDLDPASHAIAQECVKATTYYTEADDGLTKEWRGRVWLNPPYSRDKIGLFIDKMVEEIEAGRTIAAIVLAHSYTDTAWFQDIAPFMQAVCFTRGRIAFTDQHGEPCAPTQGQVFLYYGDDAETFDEVFSAFGLTLKPVRREQ
jgi:phage N-6-adenine-methyltransferase